MRGKLTRKFCVLIRGTGSGEAKRLFLPRFTWHGYRRIIPRPAMRLLPPGTLGARTSVLAAMLGRGKIVLADTATRPRAALWRSRMSKHWHG